MRLAAHDGGTRMHLRFAFESREHMEQLERRGAFEVFPQSVGQMDALLTDVQAPGGEAFAGSAEGAALLRFTRAILSAKQLDQLGRAFAAGFGRLIGVPMYGFYALEPDSPRIEHNVAVNVSDAVSSLATSGRWKPIRCWANRAGREGRSTTWT